MLVRPYKHSDLSKINAIVTALHPKWFDNNAVINIPIDAQLGKTYVIEEKSTIVGFVILSSLEGNVWINWIGVDPHRQGKSYGTNLLKYTEDFLKSLGVKKLSVDTVIEQAPADGSYDRTMQFYIKNGYKVIKKHKQQTFKEFTFRRGVLLKKI
jgi:GNAT superfamily N-acetyltransferase